MNKEVKITCDNDVMKYSPDQIYDYIYKLQNNWNELNKFVEEEKSKISKKCGTRTYISKISPYIKISDKMHELEGNND